MAAAALIAPAVLAVEDVRGRITDGPMIAGASAVMFSLVMIRVADLVRQQRETAARERTLRLAGADLVTATTEGHVGAALDKAVAELVPAGEPYVLHFHGVDGPPDLHTGTPTTTLGPVAAMAAAESLGGFENALLAEVITAGRMPGGLTRHKQVYLAAGDDLLARMEPVLEALMAQATLAIERIALTTEINRRSSEDYFRALIPERRRRDPDRRRRRPDPVRVPVGRGGFRAYPNRGFEREGFDRGDGPRRPAASARPGARRARHARRRRSDRDQRRGPVAAGRVLGAGPARRPRGQRAGRHDP